MLGLSVLLGEPVFSVIGGLGLVVITVSTLRLYPLDPRVWFATLGGLYTFAYPLLTVLGFESGQFDAKAAAIAGVFFISVLTTMWVSSVAFRDPQSFGHRELPASGRALKLVAMPVLVAVAGYVVADATLIYSAGAESKRDLWDLDVGLPLSGLLSHVFLLLGAALVLVSKTRTRVVLVVALVASVVVYFWGATGERDVVFKWVLMALFAGVLRSWVSVRWVVIIGVLAVILGPITKDLGLFIGGGEIEFVRTKQLHVYILDQEWSAAGRNLEVILRDPALYEGKGMERFVEDFSRGLMPGALYSGVNTSSWYTESYTPFVTGREVPGIGFSMVGALWIYSGFLAVVLGGVVYGAVSWWFYRQVRKGALYASGYLLYVPLALWSLRGDISFWISSLIKQIFLPLLVLFLISLFLSAAVTVRPRKGVGVPMTLVR